MRGGPFAVIISKRLPSAHGDLPGVAGVVVGSNPHTPLILQWCGSFARCVCSCPTFPHFTAVPESAPLFAVDMCVITVLPPHAHTQGQAYELVPISSIVRALRVESFLHVVPPT